MTTGPVRVQRLRTKGSRMATGAVYVGRPTSFANPWRIAQESGEWRVVWGPAKGHPYYPTPPAELVHACPTRERAHEVAVELFHHGFMRHPVLRGLALDLLAGRDLACWCPLDLACHAGVLLEFVNPKARTA